MRTTSVLLCLFAAVSLRAQEVRATITGIVTDPTSAPIAGVSITVTNLASNVAVSVASNDAGNYVTPFLAPGKYELTASATGFKKFVRQNIVLESQDKARIDIALEIGDLTSSVTISDAVTLLQTETASRQQTVATELIANIPTQGRNPFQIAWAAPGVIKSGTFRYLRSFDIGGTSGMSINGGRERENEILMDGISNVRANRTVIGVPTTESVQEFKVVTNAYDAQYGRTGGGVVSIVTKGGGNGFHGTAFEYLQAENLNANQSELNRAGIRKPPNNINQFGAQASGPVFIPKVFDGRNRLFWMLSWESMRQRSADPDVRTVPLEEWRQGDFSTLRNAQNQLVTIYDPLTTQPDATRTPLPGNRIPSARIDPIARQVLSFYPGPRTAGEGPARINNYPYPSRWIAGFDQFVGRIDLALNSKNNFFFRYGQNPFSEFRAIVFGLDNPAEPTGNAPLLRNARNFGFNWTSTISPTMTFDLKAGLNRWEEAGGSTLGAGFDPTRLGFSQTLVSQFNQLQFPRFDIEGYVSAGSDAFGPNTMDTYSLQPNLSMVRGRHFIKFGVEGRQYNQNNAGRGYPSGYYTFSRNWTQARANQADAVSGNGLATMLLGVPSQAYVQKNINAAWKHFYWAGFINDDWKVNNRLSVNFGLRWDLETGRQERFDRQVLGLDLDAASPIANRVQGLQLRGPVLFAGRDGQSRNAFINDRNNWQPRVGAAFKASEKWVFRGGYGLFYLGQDEAGTTQGFSRQTNAVVSIDNQLPLTGLSTANAFIGLPGGRLLDPIGSSQGASSFLGENITSLYRARTLPYAHQYSFDIQRELPGGLLYEVGYAGNITRGLPMNFNLNQIPVNELGRRLPNGTIDNNYYNALVPNPMQGLIPNNAALNGATVTRQTLWRAFPQFGQVALTNVPLGRQRYHGLLMKVTKRMSHGLSFLASYAVGKVLEQTSVLNQQDFSLANWQNTPLVKQPSQNIDAPQKFALIGIYDLPFGKGRALAGNANRVANFLIGGWQMNWNLTLQSGWVVNYPNANQLTPGSAKLDPGERTFTRWFNTSLWRQPNGTVAPQQEPFTLRTFPFLFSDVRRPGYKNLDASLSKYFPIKESVRAQFRFEMVNATNSPWFADIASTDVTSPAFGQLNPTQRNLPRFLKLGLHLFW